MSRVFVAREQALGRDVVVKVLAPELAQGVSAERFAREIRLAAALQEPHIVPVLAAGATADGLPWYTTPYATDRRAALYAWGVVADELLAGRHPFAGRTSPQQLMAAHSAEVPVPVPAPPAKPPVPPALAGR